MARSRLLLAVALMIAPAVMFFLILWREAVNLPILDDYQIIVSALHWMSHHNGLHARLGYVLTSEHNGYKLVFENTVVWAQYMFTGKLHILSLVAVGNAFALFIFVIVLCMSQLRVESSGERWLILVPVAWLIFQLQYSSALDFASSSLQHLAVLCFSLLSITLLDRKTATAFGMACACLALAVCSSPNGFFAAPVGVLLLAQHKRWGRAVIWIAVTAALLLAYLYHYHPSAAAGATEAGGGGSLGHPNLVYALVFLGASAARYVSIAPGLILGLLLLGVFAAATATRYYRRNRVVFYSMLFVLINAVAVSALRSDQGLAQSLASRYRIYSSLFLAFSYLFAVESLFSGDPQRADRRVAIKRLRACLVIAAYVFSIAFCCLSDRAGARFLEGKKQVLTYSYRTQWLKERVPESQAISPELANPALLRQIHDGVYAINLPVLQQAVRDGVYDPPGHL